MTHAAPAHVQMIQETAAGMRATTERRLLRKDVIRRAVVILFEKHDTGCLVSEKQFFDAYDTIVNWKGEPVEVMINGAVTMKLF